MNDNGFPLFNFGDMLKVARKRKRLTQKKLAQLLGVHYNTISAWELGTYLPETRGMVLELARCLEMNEQESMRLLEASLTALPLRWNVPYRRNPFFTGCEQILRKIHEVFQYEQKSVRGRICALSGLAGIGKTQCSIEYAYRYVDKYSAVFWLNAQTYESLIASIIAIANLLNLPEWQEQEQHRIVTAVIQWFNKHSHWLLIFDDVDDIALVKEFLPATQHGSLLFTSRRQSLGLTSHVLDLGSMPIEDGVHFLLHRAGLLTPASSSHLTASDRTTAKEIVIAMGGLPLALDQAGSYIEESRCSLSDYLRLYKMAQLRMLDEREPYADHSESVAKTFTLIFERLKRSDPRARELLIACSFLASEAIPDTFFHEGASQLGPILKTLAADPLSFYSAIKTLRMFSLLQRDAITHTLIMHRLVQIVLKEELSKPDQQIWAKRVMRAMCCIFPSSETTQIDYWQDCEQLLPHAIHLIAQNEQENEDVALDCISLMNRVASYLVERAGYAEAETLLQKALRIGERMLDIAHLHVADTLHGQGALFLRQGKYDLVEPLCLRSLNIREKALGCDHPLVASSLYCLALLYARQGRYEESEQHYLRALSIREQTLGPTHPQVAASISGLAVLYGEQGRYGEAARLYLRALSIREQALGPNHPQVATLLNNIAQDYKEQGKYEEAEPLFQRALHIWEQHLGPDHPRVAYPLNNLAVLYQEQGKYGEAEPLFHSALRIWEQKLGPEHYLVADPLEGLAHLYQGQGKFEEAEPLYQRSLRIREKALGLQHPYVAISLTGLAMLYKVQGKYEEAASLYQQALQIKEQTLGPLHPEIAEILHYQACICQARQQISQALSLYRKALTIFEQALGPDHQKAKATRCAYTQLLQETGNEGEAEASTVSDY